MKVLVTRPREASERLARRIAALGHEPVIAPMLQIVPQTGSARLPPCPGALLFTSANGVRAFARLEPERSASIFTVGTATADAAREAGFRNVACADGNVQDLASLVLRQLSPDSGHLVHLRGRDTAGDLAGALRTAGYRVFERILYAAEPIHEIPGPAHLAIRRGELGAALFFSVRAAEAFAAVLPDRDHAALAGTRAIAISQRVADALSRIRFGTIHTATTPSEDTMIAGLNAFR